MNRIQITEYLYQALQNNYIGLDMYREWKKTEFTELYMNFGTTRLRGRPRNRWQDEVMDDGRIVGGEGWQEKVRNREEWKKLLRTARNRRILHVPMERMDYRIMLKRMILRHWD